MIKVSIKQLKTMLPKIFKTTLSGTQIQFQNLKFANQMQFGEESILIFQESQTLKERHKKMIHIKIWYIQKK